MKKVILLSFILFLSFISNSYSEDLFKTLTSTYLDNKELNSQREKTKAVDETLIQSYSVFTAKDFGIPCKIFCSILIDFFSV